MTNYTLRPYQARVAEEFHDSEATAPILVMPTGAGKTVVACHLIEQHLARHNSRVLFLAHRRELIDQCSRKLDEIGVRKHGIILAGSHRQFPHWPVQVASIPTLARRIETTTHDFGLIIIDEAHHARAATYHKVIDRNPQARKLGLTATPYRMDGKALGDMFDAIIDGPSIAELISYGALIPTVTIGLPPGTKLDLSKVRTLAGDHNTHDLAKIMDRDALIGNIVKEYRRHAEGRTGVVFATDVAHSKHICDRFKQAGIPCEHLDGDTPKEEREEILARLSSGALPVVTNCQILTEGWDCPRVSCVILARPTKSRALWRQMVGRALRPFPGKTDCLIIDHANNHHVHGYPEEKDTYDLSAGLHKRKDPPRFKCPKCRSPLSGRPNFCPTCGADVRAAQDKAELEHVPEIEVDLEVIKPRASCSEAAMFYARLVRECREKGHKPGAALFRFKHRYNRFPTTRERLAAEPVEQSHLNF